MKKNVLLTMTGALIAAGVQATPTIYPKNPTLLAKINNPTNSNLVADNSDDHVIWVMPPNTAYSKVGGLHTITANTGFCTDMIAIQERNRKNEDLIQQVIEKRIAAETELDGIRSMIAAADQEYAKHIASNNLFNLTQIEDKIAELDEQITDLTAKLETCVNSCSETSSQLKELKSEKSELLKERRELAKEKRKAIQEMEQKKESVEAYKRQLQMAESKFDNIQKILNDLNEKRMLAYTSFGKMEGARASISYESKWEDNIAELKRQNPGFDFKEIQAKNAVLTANIMTNGVLPENGAILGYEIGGSAQEGRMDLAAYPSSLVGNVRLSLIGACPMLKPKDFNLDVPNGSDQMKYGLLISYEYPTTAELSFKATYHMKAMYEKIVKSSRKGGFFKSRSSSSVEEKQFFKDEFVTVWNEQESGLISEEDRATFERDMRDTLMSRFAAMNLAALPNAAQLSAGGAPASGMAVLGGELSKNKACQANIYCTGATIGVKVLDAIFGGSSSTSSYRFEKEGTAVEEWTRTKVIYKPWITSYR